MDKDLPDVAGKIVIVRLDLNVPIENGIIQDSTRADKILETIKYLINKKSHIILISHVGRPKGKNLSHLSLYPVAKYLEKCLNYKVNLIKENIDLLKKEELFQDKINTILMLENIRFYENEEKNDENFAKKLASLGDFYVNEAFSCSHRPHSSISKITQNIPSYAGIFFNKEVSALKKIISEFNEPVTCIIGGSKISTKMNIISNLIPKINNLIIVGGMANNIVHFKGFNIGKSVFEKGCENIVENIFSKINKSKCKIYYPEDFLVGKYLKDNSTYKKINEIDDEDMILDIGETSTRKIKKLIEFSKTILWNGPAGYFENPNFMFGSKEIALTIAKQSSQKKLYSVVGGGDTVSLVNKLNLTSQFNFVSTAGGAFLEYLEGKELPGIKALSQ